MDDQASIELIAGLGGLMCAGFGILALFKGLKADGVIDLAALAKGKVKMGGAGVLLLFVGTLITLALILHHQDIARMTLTVPDGSKPTIVVDGDFKASPEEEFAKITKSLNLKAPSPQVRPPIERAENSVERFRSLQKAAAAGRPMAMKELGLLYANGIPNVLEKDLGKSVEYFRQAAEKNYAAAKSLLAECYMQGKGVPKDQGTALKLLREAAAAEDLRGMECLGAYLGRADDPRPVSARKEEFEQAFTLLSKAEEKGSTDALASLGAMSMNGTVPGSHGPDCKKGAELFKDGAKKGNMGCMFYYARCLEYGIGVKKNELESGNWYMKAANEGFNPAVEWCHAHPGLAPGITPAS